MDKKRRLKIACSCIITIALLTVSLKYLTDLMELKTSDTKYLPFLEQDEDFDVLFIGSSHVVLGIYPMELWNDYGVVSYNMGGNGNMIPTSYWVMKNALEYTNPKLMVIDCFGLGVETKTNDIFSYVHTSFDVFPADATKMAAIYDLLDDPEMDRKIQDGTARELRERTGMELWWDFLIYHTRWNELEEDDFAVPLVKTKGAEYRAGIAVPAEVTKISDGKKLEGETAGVQYLRKMIQDCQNKGIEVLLVYIPYPAMEGGQMDANRVYDIAEEYGVDYINFLNMDTVNYDTDCYDEFSHLNASGAQKVTNYIGQYIVAHYDIPDQRSNPAYGSWYEDYREWTEEKIDTLKETEELDIYLMLLEDRRFEAEIEIYNSAIWEDEYYVRLLKNAGIDEENYETIIGPGNSSGEGEGSPDVRITVKDRATEEIVDQTDFYINLFP